MSKQPTPDKLHRLSPAQLRQNIERIQRGIAEIENFEPASVQERWAPETRTLGVAIDDTLSKTFATALNTIGTPQRHSSITAAW
ncbi:hypothetical protein ACVI1L_004450 [Bradyrhizobium sp. USDA 4516]